jgi:hypothetical protein
MVYRLTLGATLGLTETSSNKNTAKREHFAPRNGNSSDVYGAFFSRDDCRRLFDAAS